MHGDRLREHITRFLAALKLWASRGRERRRLQDLEDHLLDDIGVARDAALREAQRPPWSGSRVRSHDAVADRPRDRAWPAQTCEAAPQRRPVIV